MNFLVLVSAIASLFPCLLIFLIFRKQHQTKLPYAYGDKLTLMQSASPKKAASLMLDLLHCGYFSRHILPNGAPSFKDMKYKKRYMKFWGNPENMKFLQDVEGACDV